MKALYSTLEKIRNNFDVKALNFARKQNLSWTSDAQVRDEGSAERTQD